MSIHLASAATPARAPARTRALAAGPSFEGYASVFNVPDLGGDVVVPGAFRDCLARRGARGVRMLFQHDPAQPIGVWSDLVEDARGLFVRGRLSVEVPRAAEILALLRDGALDGLSIGFRASTARRDAKTGLRRLVRIDLWEISIVTFPLLPQARVARVQSQAARDPIGAISAATRLMRASLRA